MTVPLQIPQLNPPLLGVATLPPDAFTRYFAKVLINSFDRAIANGIVQQAYVDVSTHREFGVNASFLLTMMILETDHFRSDKARKSNNFVGLGATDPPIVWYWAFGDSATGIRAAASHLLGYSTAVHTLNNPTLGTKDCRSYDPRHAFVSDKDGIHHLNRVTHMLDLNNAGWSIRSSQYGTDCLRIYTNVANA